MFSVSAARHVVVPRMARILVVAILALTLFPSLSAAQTTKDEVIYAAAELNLRKGPGSGDAVVAIVPLGAELRRTGGAVTNDYAPVTYNGRTGWVVALGVVATPQEVPTTRELVTDPAPVADPALVVAPVAAPVAAPAPAPVSTSPSLFSSNVRYTLEPLMLRSAPGIDAEPLAGMPEGEMVTLTREGAENGYVTVDYGGLHGWAYADFLSEVAPAA